MKTLMRITLAIICLVASLAAADSAWKWSGPSGDQTVSLLIIGDIQIQRRADPATAFAHLRDTMRAADLVYANLEGVLVKSKGPDGDIPDKKGWIHPGPDAIVALKSANVQVVGTANNVAWGRENIMATVAQLAAAGIAHAGSGKNIDEAHKPAIVTRKGVKFGFLQYTARWYRDNEQIATDIEPGVAKITSRDGITIDPADVERVRNDIKKLRSQVDIIVVSHHNRDGATPVQFGDKPTLSPAPAATATVPAGGRSGAGMTARNTSEQYQKQFAHLALDAGADLVYGHGTHTVQGVEVYKDKPILYAVGHSAFDQPRYEDAKDGLVVHVVVQNKSIRRVAFVPVTRDTNNDVLMLDPASADAAKVLQIIRSQSENLALKTEGQEVVLLDKTAAAPKKTTAR
jgi:poly-gamma-glutamate synthesis protein (capsule biosynthesis protein)